MRVKRSNLRLEEPRNLENGGGIKDEDGQEVEVRLVGRFYS